MPTGRRVNAQRKRNTGENMNYQRIVLSNRIQCDDSQGKKIEGAIDEFLSLRTMPVGDATGVFNGSDYSRVEGGKMTFLIDAELEKTHTPLNHPLEQKFATDLREALIELSQSNELFKGTEQAIRTLEFDVIYASPWFHRLECCED
jgi:hypothetical protein